MGATVRTKTNHSLKSDNWRKSVITWGVTVFLLTLSSLHTLFLLLWTCTARNRLQHLKKKRLRYLEKLHTIQIKYSEQGFISLFLNLPKICSSFTSILCFTIQGNKMNSICNIDLTIFNIACLMLTVATACPYVVSACVLMSFVSR